MRKLLIILLGTACALVFALFFAARSTTFSGYVKQELMSAAARSGVRVSIDEFGTYVAGAAARTIELYFTRALFLLRLDSLNVDVALASLITLSPRLTFSGELYSGSMRGTARTGKKGNLNLHLESLHLAEHDQIRGLGISSGLLSLDLSDLTYLPEGPASGEAALTLSQLTKDGSKSGALPILSFIPEIRDGELRAKAALSPQSLDLSALSFSSSLGTLEGSGACERASLQNFSRCSFAADLDLSAAGQAAVGPWLALLSRNQQIPGPKCRIKAAWNKNGAGSIQVFPLE